MQVPLQIILRDMIRSDTLDAKIRSEALKLERRYPRLTSCRISVDEERKRTRPGRLFAVHIDVRAPGHVDVVSSQKQNEDVYVAVRDAFDAVKRQLHEVVGVEGEPAD